ncbi:MAG TPA: glycosyltransferase family 9 protein, partial [Cyclobacteriaceae bacterium]|nr:glycosyltransferase family 9 protein [Cyclobacteriaceae bacterium]
MPKKILAIRFQALGDLMITLPYLQSLKEQAAGVRIHLLTRREVCEIPKNLALFEKVFSIGGGRNAKVQFLLSLLALPFLWWQRYDVVIDLQNHRISKIIRKLLNSRAWSEFDRSSRNFAGERTRLTLNVLMIAKTHIATQLELKSKIQVDAKLKACGWDGKKDLLILNPAGAFTSRQWPLENYITFSRLWMERHSSCQFLILGLNSLKPKSSVLKKDLAGNLIDMTGITTLTEAFAIVKLSLLVLTEDSGLMHMSWVQGVPTVALLGSTPGYWSSPLGTWTRTLNSSDLPCGD